MQCSSSNCKSLKFTFTFKTQMTVDNICMCSILAKSCSSATWLFRITLDKMQGVLAVFQHQCQISGFQDPRFFLQELCKISISYLGRSCSQLLAHSRHGNGKYDRCTSQHRFVNSHQFHYFHHTLYLQTITMLQLAAIHVEFIIPNTNTSVS